MLMAVILLQVSRVAGGWPGWLLALSYFGLMFSQNIYGTGAKVKCMMWAQSESFRTNTREASETFVNVDELCTTVYILIDWM